ncbi:MAG: hypothetical protein K2P19_13100 [Kineothrix sp.]|nr:hypothetical protein [Kineothrix sp.]
MKFAKSGGAVACRTVITIFDVEEWDWKGIRRYGDAYKEYAAVGGCRDSGGVFRIFFLAE